MINKQFGIYLVLEKDIEKSKIKKRTYWICECQKCKTIQSVRDDGVKRNPKSCPSCKHDITGQIFGRLKVLYKTKIDKNGHQYYMCECECGNKKEISSSNLIQGATLSCGCLHKEITSKINFEDLTGQKFGKLTVIKKSSSLGERTKWLCQCECENYTEVQSNNLKNNHTISCGCIHSKGELKIRKILNNLNIFFKAEYSFLDLPKRRFDFYLPDQNTCIEFNGKQHYTFVDTWHKSKEEFENSIKRDNEKIEYCKKNNINLIIIPYYDYNKLTEEYLKELLK